MGAGRVWRTEILQSASALMLRQGDFCQSRHCHPTHRHTSRNPCYIALSRLAQERQHHGTSWPTGHSREPALSVFIAVQTIAQVPRAPGSCTVVFGPPKDGKADSPLVSGWSVHGEDMSQAALHILPEWAEVIYRAHASLALCSGDAANHERPRVLCQAGC